MKTKRTRKAISQSMDLFIIIAAVLAAGGVVAASVSGLIGAAAANSTVTIVQSSLTGGTASASGGTSTLALTVKNVGSSSVSIASSDFISLAINTQGSSTPTCTNTLTVSLGGTWTQSPGTGAGLCAGATSLKWSPGTPATLAPGQQMTFNVVITTSAANAVNPTTTGNAYALNVLLGSTTLTQNLVSQ